MEEHSKSLIERWERKQNRPPEKKRRNYLRLGIILGACLIVAFVIVFFMTDIISRPKVELGVEANPGEWAMYGRDIRHSGLETLGVVNLEGTVTKVLATGAPVHSSPVIADGILYIGSRDGNMYALDETSGKLIWYYKTRSWVDSSATIANNVVYFGSNDGTFNALNARTGEKIWSFKVKYPIKSSAAVADGRVYFGGDDYVIYCLDVETGKKIWSKETDGPVSSSPVISDGILFCGSVDGNLYALDAASGRQRLLIKTSKIIVSSPVVSEDTVYFATSEAGVFAVDGKARNWFGEFVLRPPWQVLHLYGDLPAPPAPSGYLWSIYSPGDFTSASPTLYGDNLYIGLGNKVVSFNTIAQGKEWSVPTASSISYAGVLSENTVYATGANGYLYVLKKSNGEIIREIPVGGPISSNPLMVDGRMYVSSEDGCLYRVE